MNKEEAVVLFPDSQYGTCTQGLATKLEAVLITCSSVFATMAICLLHPCNPLLTDLHVQRMTYISYQPNKKCYAQLHGQP